MSGRVPSSHKKGVLETLRKEPPVHSIILDIAEMGPVAAKSYPGQRTVDVNARPAERAQQEIGDGRRGSGLRQRGGCRETTGGCWTQCYPQRIKEHFVGFLCYVDEQIPAQKERTYAIMDNLDMHQCHDLLLFMIHHPWLRVRLPAQVRGALEPD